MFIFFFVRCLVCLMLPVSRLSILNSPFGFIDRLFVFTESQTKTGWCLCYTKLWLLIVLTQKQSFVRHSHCCHNHVWVMNSITMSQTLETKFIIHIIRTRLQQKWMKAIVWCLNVDICVVSLRRVMWNVWIFSILWSVLQIIMCLRLVIALYAVFLTTWITLLISSNLFYINTR